MFKKLFMIPLILISLASFCFSEAKTVTIQGKVEEIANDGSYFVLSGQKIISTPEFLEDSLLEVGDSVEIVAEETANGLVAVNYKYLHEEGMFDEIDEPAQE